MSFWQSVGGLFKNIISPRGRPHAATTGSISDLRNPALWLVDAIAGRKTPSGERVTSQSAMHLAPYYAAIRAISEDVAKIPLIVYRRMRPRGKERASDHPVFHLLKRWPNEHMGSMSFRETLTHFALSWGNGYAEIERDGAGTPIALWPVHPARVVPRRVEGEIVYDIRVGDVGDIRVESFNGQANLETVRLPAEDMFHLHGLGPNGLIGYSVLRFAAEAVGLGLAAQTYGGAFFGNGTQLGGVLRHPEKLEDEALKRLRETWMRHHEGAGNAWKPAILEEGMEWESIGIPPKDAQFIQARQFQIVDIARWFRIPPHKIGWLEKATFTNIEQQNIEYVNDTLTAWFTRWEQEIDRKLFFSDETDVFAEHVVAALLRGDAESRAAFYRSQFDIGALSPNDVRELENMNPIGPEGDEYFLQLNLATVKDVVAAPPQEPAGFGGFPPAAPPARPAPERALPAPPEEADENDDDEPGRRMTGAARRLFVDAGERVLARQIKAVERAGKRHILAELEDFEAWAYKFHIGQAGFMMTAFEPAFDAVSRMAGVEPDADALSQWACDSANTFAARTITDFRDGRLDDLVEDWKECRTEKADAMATEVLGLISPKGGDDAISQ